MMSEPVTLKLYPKQALALNSPAQWLVYGGSKGSGKLILTSTLIPTVDKGFVTMQDLQVGDKVFDKDGKPCNVVAKSEVDYSEQAYEITFETGEVIIAGENHEWLILTDKERNWKEAGFLDDFGFLRKTEELYLSDTTWHIQNVTKTDFHTITSIKPVENTGMQCIQVDSPDHTYCITESYIPTHNSFLIRAASIIYAIEIPGITIYVFRKNYNDLMANHVHTSNHGYLQMLKPMLDQKLVSYNKSEYAFVFENGSRIQLAHLNNDSDLLSYQGRELGVLFLDESTQFSDVAIMTLISCMRLGSLNVPDKWKGKVPRCIMTTNPGGISHDFHKERFVDFGTEMHQHPLEWGKMWVQYIPAFLTDNKVLMENDPTYKDRLYGLSVDSPELVRAMLEGDWNITAHSAFHAWNRDIHVINPFRIPSTWKILRAYDYGFSAPYSVLWAAVSNGEDYIDDEGNYCTAPKDSIFIIAEIYGATPENKGLKEQPSETAKRVKEMDESLQALGYRIHPGPADNSIFNKDRGNSIAKIFSDNGVQWLRSNKNPGSRVLGLQIVNQMVYNATQATPEGSIFKIFKTCPYVAKQLPALPRSKLKMEDIDTNANDHSWDSTRYLCLHVRNAMQTKQVLGL